MSISVGNVSARGSMIHISSRFAATLVVAGLMSLTYHGELADLADDMASAPPAVHSDAPGAGAQTRTGRPKERDKTPTNDRVGTPPPPVVQPADGTDAAARRGRPKERDDPVSTRSSAPPTPVVQPAVGTDAAARPGRPKIKEKLATNGRVATPPTTVVVPATTAASPH